MRGKATQVHLLSQFHTYGDPDRDRPRRNVSVVYVAEVDKIDPNEEECRKEGIRVEERPLDRLPKLGFDHNEIVSDYLAWKRRLLPLSARRGTNV